MTEIKQYVKDKKEKIKQLNLQNLKLVIIQVGTVEASSRYVKNKLKDCAEVNLPAELIQLPETVSEKEILDLIASLNKDDSVTGFIVQLPLPKQISEEHIIEAIAPEKDIDGFHPLSKTVPATPLGMINYLEDQGYNFDGKNCVILGRSLIVGQPAHKLLLDRNMNVIMLHTHTSAEDKKFYIEHADLIISAAGRRNILDDSYNIKPNAVILDVGINFDENGKLCGDCNYESLVNKVAFISPTPGGVGLLTRIAVIENLISLSKIKR